MQESSGYVEVRRHTQCGWRVGEGLDEQARGGPIRDLRLLLREKGKGKPLKRVLGGRVNMISSVFKFLSHSKNIPRFLSFLKDHGAGEGQK